MKTGFLQDSLPKICILKIFSSNLPIFSNLKMECILDSPRKIPVSTQWQLLHVVALYYYKKCNRCVFLQMQLGMTRHQRNLLKKKVKARKRKTRKKAANRNKVTKVKTPKRRKKLNHRMKVMKARRMKNRQMKSQRKRLLKRMRVSNQVIITDYPLLPFVTPYIMFMRIASPSWPAYSCLKSICQLLTCPLFFSIVPFVNRGYCPERGIFSF